MTKHASAGDLLKSLRARHGLDPKGLAEKSGVPHITIYFIESGRTRSPKVETLQLLAEAVGEPVTSLLAVRPRRQAKKRRAHGGHSAKRQIDCAADPEGGAR